MNDGEVVTTTTTSSDGPSATAETSEDEEMEQLFRQATKACGATQTLVDYIDVDRNIPASEHLSLREIAAQSEKTPFELEEDEDEDIESGKEQEIVSNNEAESAISTLRLYLQQHESTSEDLTLLNNMERRLSKIMTTAKKQSSIKSFFKTIQKDSHQM